MSMHVISHFASFFQRSLGYFSDHVARIVLCILLAVNSLSFGAYCSQAEMVQVHSLARRTAGCRHVDIHGRSAVRIEPYRETPGASSQEGYF